MKFVFAILAIFIASIALDAKARELNLKEKMLILNLEKIEVVQNFALTQIDPKKLSIGDFLSYKILKNSCKPVFSLLEDIKNAPEDYKDQSTGISTYLNVCSQSVNSLVFMGLETN